MPCGQPRSPDTLHFRKIAFGWFLAKNANQKERSVTMSIFGKIMSAIFGTQAQAAEQGQVVSNVDVAAVLDKAVAAKGEKLDWRNSIVDLMKAIDLDSSLANRKQLAKDLNYTGDTNDSASMNIWLHKQVMDRLAKNSGKPTSDLMKK
jgi:CRISPR/Cas system endoribonuclease Cas6 (RAMP superfamily)